MLYKDYLNILLKIFSVSLKNILFYLTLLLIGCATYITTISYSEPIEPEWFDYLNNQPKCIAIFPFDGYGMKGKSTARKIESTIRKNLIEWNQYKVVERRYLAKILSEQRLLLSGLVENHFIKIGELVASDIILIGEVIDYYEEENYIDHEYGESFEADSYERLAVLSLSIKIIAIETGETIYEKENTYNSKSIGYKNIIRKEVQEKGGLDGIIQINKLSRERNLPQLKAFSTLREKCITIAIDDIFPNLVIYKNKYSDRYEISRGKKKLISRKLVGISR